MGTLDISKGTEVTQIVTRRGIPGISGDAAAQTHIDDSDGAHDASAVDYDPSGDSFTATDVQALGVEAAGRLDTAEAHAADVANPHSVSKTQVGLGNVDNTSDANKPVSTAQEARIQLHENADPAHDASAISYDGSDVVSALSNLNTRVSWIDASVLSHAGGTKTDGGLRASLDCPANSRTRWTFKTLVPDQASTLALKLWWLPTDNTAGNVFFRPRTLVTMEDGVTFTAPSSGPAYLIGAPQVASRVVVTELAPVSVTPEALVVISTERVGDGVDDTYEASVAVLGLELVWQ